MCLRTLGARALSHANSQSQSVAPSVARDPRPLTAGVCCLARSISARMILSGAICWRRSHRLGKKNPHICARRTLESETGGNTQSQTLRDPGSFRDEGIRLRRHGCRLCARARLSLAASPVQMRQNRAHHVQCRTPANTESKTDRCDSREA